MMKDKRGLRQSTHKCDNEGTSTGRNKDETINRLITQIRQTNQNVSTVVRNYQNKLRNVKWKTHDMTFTQIEEQTQRQDMGADTQT